MSKGPLVQDSRQGTAAGTPACCGRSLASASQTAARARAAGRVAACPRVPSLRCSPVKRMSLGSYRLRGDSPPTLVRVKGLGGGGGTRRSWRATTNVFVVALKKNLFQGVGFGAGGRTRSATSPCPPRCAPPRCPAPEVLSAWDPLHPPDSLQIPSGAPPECPAREREPPLPQHTASGARIRACMMGSWGQGRGGVEGTCAVRAGGPLARWRVKRGGTYGYRGSYLRLIDSCITQLKAQGPVPRVKKKKKKHLGSEMLLLLYSRYRS